MKIATETIIPLHREERIFKTPEPTGLSRATIIKIGEDFAKEHEWQRIESEADLMMGDVPKLVLNIGGEIIRDTRMSNYHKDYSVKFFEGRYFTISLSGMNGYIRDRFILTKIIGHLVLHNRMSRCSPMKIPRDVPEDLDNEAQWFAEGFPMPEVELRKQFNSGEYLLYIQGNFLVPLDVLKIRLNYLGLNWKYKK